ncbi:MAG: class 1 fructose-bisphosphatase [bacterium]|nr:class 1 fructose-bisphosphatase [bacterium]
MNQGSFSQIITIQQHILEQQRSHPTATGAFSWLLSGLTLATKIIESQVRRAGVLDVLGETGETNVQGERVKKLDMLANKTLMRCLGYRDDVGILVSEEDEDPRLLKAVTEKWKYVVLFDPLDGSSNIDVNVSVGTIFSILQKREDMRDDHDPAHHVLQPGYLQLAAGYVVYGSSTVMAYTTGDGVHMFTLVPEIGAYILSQERVRIPESGKMYSVNEAYAKTFSEGYQRYLSSVKDEGYSLRYIGSLVADFHRTLLRGGVFLYPGTKKDPGGKLRLLYEANPMAFLVEQAGGAASDGKGRILDKHPKRLHERTPLVIGSRNEVEKVHQALGSVG